MTFTTLTFLIFFVAVFALYWSLRSLRAQNILLVIASYVFYGWWDWRFCLLMVAASLVDFSVGLGLNKAEVPWKRKFLLTCGLTCNLSMLGFFKYFNFFAENFQIAAAQIGWQMDPFILNVVLPVGISFYTFQTMSYSIDIYRRKLRGTTQLLEYLAYVSFFPQLVAGPIERATHLLPQFFKERLFSEAQATDGCKQILWGLFKKMVIADNLAPIVEAAFSNPSAYNGAELALATIFFAFQIYCDFSAYSDIAIGVAKLLGFELMRNFAYPYFSQSVGEFWRRWHISLSTWFKDYVYFPLGGNRVGQSRLIFNVMVTFLLSGLWHGASWNFLIWGALNGLGVLPEILRPRHSKRNSSEIPVSQPSVGACFKILATFTFICVGWVFFRAQTFAGALLVLERIGTSFLSSAGGLLARHDPTDGRIFIVLPLLVGLEWVKRRYPHPLVFERWPRFARGIAYAALFWTIVYLGTYGSSTFIYFQF
ncbi:MAG TPA: MBOAT family protein [Methylomirabilota bacterium]|nr:MBOAT family protein [Methylomirabilota bacterium]